MINYMHTDITVFSGRRESDGSYIVGWKMV